MTGNSYPIPDTVVSLAAIAGLCFVILRIRALSPDNNLALRFEAALSVVALFLTLRLFQWNTDWGFFSFATYATAALIPLMALLLAEGLLRRHAPKWAKIYLSAGALVLGLAALWPSVTISEGFTGALLGFQLSGFLIVAGLVATRDRDSLSATENRTVHRVSLSLLLILPFLVSDYSLVAAIPVRLSGLAILVTCWLSLSLSRPKSSHRFYAFVLALYVATAAGAAAVLAWQHDFGWTQSLQAGAIVLCLVMLAAIVRDDLHTRDEATENAIIAEIGMAEAPSLAAYLDVLAQRGVLDGVLLLDEPDLAEFDRAAIAARFRGASALAASDLPGDPGNDDFSQSQLRALFERYAATHLFEVSRRPLVVAAVRQPGFVTREIDRDLSAAFGLARLISERDRLRARLAPGEDPAA